MEFLAGENFDQPDFAGARHMRSAAGADVHARERHDAHVAGQLLFAAVGDGFQRFRIRMRDLRRDIAPDRGVGLLLDRAKLLRGQDAGKIDGDPVRTHVEAHVVIAEAPVDDAAEQMLTAVLLHEVEPPLPVERAVYGRAGRERGVAVVDDLAAAPMCVRHAHTGECPGVAGLAAALRIERRPVEHDVVAVLSGRAGEHLRIKFPHMGILIVKSVRLHILNAPVIDDFLIF